MEGGKHEHGRLTHAGLGLAHDVHTQDGLQQRQTRAAAAERNAREMKQTYANLEKDERGAGRPEFSEVRTEG